MTDKANDGPAFPFNEKEGDGTHYHSHAGMTMRDYFAAKAMAALLQNALDNEITFDGYDSFDGMIAEQAYGLADAMLAARSAS